MVRPSKVEAACALLATRRLTLTPASARLMAVTAAGLAVEVAAAAVQAAAVGDDVAWRLKPADAERIGGR
jgi:hypothetical protein